MTIDRHIFQAPTGTRDFYPVELARRRYIESAWRRAWVCHGFEEIDGPTFEHLDLYTVKSGEGIVSELFSFKRFGGEKDFALRPEFTPTLARMFAARAAGLPRPTKWFSVGPYFRAERPQRGRLREFLQWNADVLGAGESEQSQAQADAETIALCVGGLESLGLAPESVRVRIGHRAVLERLCVQRLGLSASALPGVFALIDRSRKITADEFRAQGRELGLDGAALAALSVLPAQTAEAAAGAAEVAAALLAPFGGGHSGDGIDLLPEIASLRESLAEAGIGPWCVFDLSIARGLAYYTGTVFEVIVGGERAVAGGGRYDHLIELFGGPPTPAVGFGMGDVVLALVLQDRGLLPSDDEIAESLGLRPDVFVVAAGEEAQALVAPMVARLRREGLHARRSSKSTRNVGKLLKDAASQRARVALILENPTEVSLKDLDRGAQLPERVPIDRAAQAVHDLLKQRDQASDAAR